MRSPLRPLAPAALALALGACVDGSVSSSADTAAAAPTTMVVAPDEPFPDERCAANRSAGEIVIAAEPRSLGAAGTTDVAVAADRGYFADLCLEVAVVTDEDPLGTLADGRAHFAVAPSFSEVVRRSLAGETELLALTVDGRTSLDTLIVAPPTATDPIDPTGWTIAATGELPRPVSELIGRLGASADAVEVTDPDDRRIVDLLGPIGDVDAVVGSKSTDVVALERDGVGIEVLDPREYGVAGSFGVLVTSAEFLDDNAIVTVDVVRAVLHGLDDAVATPDDAIESVADSPIGTVVAADDLELASLRWLVEADLIVTGTPEGVGFGSPVIDTLQAELENSTDAVGAADAADHVADGVAASVYDGDALLIWPS
ncbi:MAG: ABC transporter substrate-binding protein [Actinomycetota bacterium]